MVNWTVGQCPTSISSVTPTRKPVRKVTKQISIDPRIWNVAVEYVNGEIRERSFSSLVERLVLQELERVGRWPVDE